MNRFSAKPTITPSDVQALVEIAALLLEQPEEIKAVIKEAYWRTARELSNEVKRKSSSSHKQVLRRLRDWRKDHSLTGKKGPSRCNFGVMPSLYTKLLTCQEANFRLRAELPTLPAPRLMLDWSAFLLTLLLEKGLFYFVSVFCQLVFRYNSSEVEIIDNKLQAEAGQWFSQASQARANRLEMVSKIKARYGARLQTEISAGKEEEFIRSAQLHEDFARVNQLFCLLAPALPNCTTLWKSRQDWQQAMQFRAGHKADRAMSNTFDQIQLHRLHALLHNDCFARLCAQARLAPPATKLNVPQVFESGTRMNKFNHNSEVAAAFDRPTLAQELTAEIAREAALAEEFAGQRLHVFANEQLVGVLEPGAALELELPAHESQIIKLRPARINQDVLVSSFYLTEDELVTATSAWETSSHVGANHVHKLTIAPLQMHAGQPRVQIRVVSERASEPMVARVGEWFSNANVWDRLLTPQMLSLGLALAVLMTALIDLQLSKVTVARPQRIARQAEQPPQAQELIEGITTFYDGYAKERARRSNSNKLAADATGSSPQARLERIRLESNRYLANKSASKMSSSAPAERPGNHLVTRNFSRLW